MTNKLFDISEPEPFSTIAIIDAEAPQSLTFPQRERSQYFENTSDEPPPYGSLPPGTRALMDTSNVDDSGDHMTVHIVLGDSCILSLGLKNKCRFF